jgi:hypothetical protein
MPEAELTGTSCWSSCGQKLIAPKMSILSLSVVALQALASLSMQRFEGLMLSLLSEAILPLARRQRARNSCTVAFDTSNRVTWR